MTPQTPRDRPVLRAALMDVLDNQIRDNDPPETRATLERLLALGIDREEARRLLGCVIASELFDVMKSNTPFDRKRFVTRLHSLPAMPWADEQS